jgi:hypothetical protein
MKKEGLQLPPETADEPEQKVSVREEPTREKPAVKEKSRTKKATEADYESIFFKSRKPMPVMGKRSISDQSFTKS